MFGRLTKLPFKVAHSLARRIQEKEEARQAELLAERGAEESAEAARSGPPIPTRELADLSADEVSMDAADALAEGVGVVDVRRQAAGDAPAVPEATRIPLEDLMIRLAELPAGAGADHARLGVLAEAVADCRIVVGASARLRTVSWPQLTPRAAAQLAHVEAVDAPVAFVFGRESSGLSNDELDLCTHLMHIPTNPDFSSLNVAMAIQVVVYELMVLQATPMPATSEAPAYASNAQMEGFFAHLGQALEDIGFADERRSEKLMRRLRRLFHRAAPETDELNILRGILSAAQGRKSMRRR